MITRVFPILLLAGCAQSTATPTQQEPDPAEAAASLPEADPAVVAAFDYLKEFPNEVLWIRVHENNVYLGFALKNGVPVDDLWTMTTGGAAISGSDAIGGRTFFAWAVDGSRTAKGAFNPDSEFPYWNCATASDGKVQEWDIPLK